MKSNVIKSLLFTLSSPYRNYFQIKKYIMFDSLVNYQQCKKLITRYTQVSSTNSGSSRDPFLKWEKQKSRPESISIAEALKRYKGDKGVNLSRNTQYSYYITNVHSTTVLSEWTTSVESQHVQLRSAIPRGSMPPLWHQQRCLGTQFSQNN